MIHIDVLGASGGIGGGRLTTAIRVQRQILLDVGTGVGQLSREELLEIDAIFLSHAHLDHIALLPMLADLRISYNLPSIRVYALPQVIETLETHIFNWKIWPDFTRLLSPEQPVIRFYPVEFNEEIVEHGLNFSPFPVDHVVPCAGWHVRSNGRSFAFTGDTKTGGILLDWVRTLTRLDVLMIECAFPNRLQELADVSKHITPNDLKALLVHLPKDCQLWVTHLKPEQAREIGHELKMSLPPDRFLIVKDGMHLVLGACALPTKK